MIDTHDELYLQLAFEGHLEFSRSKTFSSTSHYDVKSKKNIDGSSVAIFELQSLQNLIFSIINVIKLDYRKLLYIKLLM